MADANSAKARSTPKLCVQHRVWPWVCGAPHFPTGALALVVHSTIRSRAEGQCCRGAEPGVASIDTRWHLAAATQATTAGSQHPPRAHTCTRCFRTLITHAPVPRSPRCQGGGREEGGCGKGGRTREEGGVTKWSPLESDAVGERRVHFGDFVWSHRVTQ